MGKSTFARSIDPMRSGDKMTVKLRNIEIRSYYLNDSYLGTVSAFCNTVNDLFNRDSEGEKLFNSAGSSLPLIQPGSNTPGKDLAKLLNFYRNAYERHYGSSRLLFIIDGIEEVPASTKGSVLDFIPGAEDLDEGVFILITSRTDEELPLHVRSAEALKKEILVCSVTVDRTHEGYRSVLNDYAQKYIAADLKRHGIPDIKNLLEKSEYRFLYVRLFRDLLRSFDGAVPGKLPEGGELLEAYLERMESLYGEKFYSAVADLMAILAGAYEPLTLNEIAYLYGNDEPDFLMLAHLADLRGFLKTERSYRGNLISLHVQWKTAAKVKLQNRITGMVEVWVKECGDFDEKLIAADNDGMTYLFSRIAEYAKEHIGGDDWVSEPLASNIRECYFEINKKSRTIMDVERQMLHADGGVEINKMLAPQKFNLENDLADVYISRGVGFYDKQEINGAITDYNHALEIYEKLDAEGRLLDQNDLAITYLNRGHAFLDQEDYSRAITDYNRAIDIRVKLDADGRLTDQSMLANAYISRGNVFSNQQNISGALSDYNRAIEICEKLDAEGQLHDQNDLARAYIRRGYAFSFQQNISGVLSDYNRAIGICEKLDADGRLIDRSNLAWAYIYRGKAFSDQQNTSKAITDYNRAIEILENLAAEGRLLDQKNLAITYISRGLAFYDQQDIPGALIDYNRSIEILEKLDAEGRLPNRSAFAECYLYRGIAFFDQQVIDSALSDYNRGIEIFEKLAAEGRLLDHYYLIKLYYKSISAYLLQNNFTGAFALCERLVKIQMSRMELHYGTDNVFLSKKLRNDSLLRHCITDGREFESVDISSGHPEEGITVRKTALPFYRGAMLCEAVRTSEPYSAFYYIEHMDSRYLLDGTSDPIDELNEKIPINITKKTAIEYLRFFCFFVHDDGPFYVVDSLEHPVFDSSQMDKGLKEMIFDSMSSPVVLKIPFRKFFTVAADIIHGDTLFTYGFRVNTEGRVEVAYFKERVSGIPVRKLKIDY